MSPTGPGPVRLGELIGVASISGLGIGALGGAISWIGMIVSWLVTGQSTEGFGVAVILTLLAAGVGAVAGGVLAVIVATILFVVHQLRWIPLAYVIVAAGVSFVITLGVFAPERIAGVVRVIVAGLVGVINGVVTQTLVRTSSLARMTDLESPTTG